MSNARLDETVRLSPAGAVVVLELDGWVTPNVDVERFEATLSAAP